MQIISISGMGFHPRNVSRVVHTCPSRNASQYLQEIGRAGRQGQSSIAALYFGNRDIATNLPGMKEDIITYCKTEDSCLRNCLLSVFGFEKDTSITDCNCWSFCRSQYFCEECVVWFDEQALMSGQLMWSEEIWIKLIFMYFTFYFFSNTDKKIDDNF